METRELDRVNVNGYSFSRISRISDLRNWLYDTKVFNIGELNDIFPFELNDGHLKLISLEDEDPGIVSFVYGMNGKHLKKFNSFVLSEDGLRDSNSLVKLWLNDAANFSENSIDKNPENYLLRHTGECIRLFEREKAYWVLDNREKSELFTCRI